MIAVHLVLAALLLAVAFYAHHRIGFHTASARNVLITRAVLLVVGLAAGYAAAASAKAAPSYSAGCRAP